MVRDVEFLHALMMDQKETIKSMGLENVSYLENYLTEITYQMMVNGFGVDTKGWLKFAEEEEKKYDAIQAELTAIADINWNSWQQYCEFFGVHRTEDLDSLPSSPALELFRASRKHYKNVTTYGKEWIAQHVHDGLVRCQYTQMVNTARYSCDKPNLQNIPSDTPHRSFMVPGHGKNNVFIIADFSGQEMAIMAVGANEPKWLDCLRSGGDLHNMVAEDILGDEYIHSTPQVKSRLRKQVKIINFSIAYGAGIDTIAERAGTDSRTISMRLSKMRRAYPALFRWLESNGRNAKSSYESRSFPPFNRFRSLRMEVEGWRRVNIGKNNPVQMTAADMAKLSMYYFNREIEKGLPALFIHMLHDELIVECTTSKSKKVARALVAAMNRGCEDILGEPLSTPEVKIQKNWDKRKD